MKIFATSDIHGNQAIIDAIKLFAPQMDLILICGDISGAKKGLLSRVSSAQKKDADYLCKVLDSINTESRFILGNDDWFEYDNPRCLTSAELIHGMNFVPFEWVPLTPFNTNREANEHKIVYELSKLEPLASSSIIVAHGPPWGAGDTLDSGFPCGSRSVTNWIKRYRPKIWFCGHIHEDFYAGKIGETMVFNCACDPGKGILRGWMVDTDTMVYQAVSMPTKGRRHVG